MLQFLDSNGYRTLDADEYVSIISGQQPVPDKAVLITFDDGWGSLWTIGFPLLKRFNMKAVVFIPPGRISHASHQWPDLNDLDAGRCRPEEVLGRDRSTHPLLSWEEIAIMHASGLVDFQSHSYSHALVRTGTRIIDYVNPGLLSGFNMLEFPCSKSKDGHGVNPVRLGEPLYETVPRLSDARELTGGDLVKEACADFVGKNGGELFFRYPNWRVELDGVARAAEDASKGLELETQEEQVKNIRFELVASKKSIEEKLPGKTVQHICYPWHVAGKITIEETRRAGYTGAFWGKVRGRYCSEIPGDPMHIARVGGDFFFRLPGEGRYPLSSILMSKITRRAKEGSPYLTH